MESKLLNGLRLFFDSEEQEAAQLIGRACSRSGPLISNLWGLEMPKECRVYVMTSWQGFLLHAAPWTHWGPLVLTLPFWYRRVKKTWRVTGGWTQQFGRRRAVGIKPARLMELADHRIGKRIFVNERSIEEKVEHVTCHELTHAFSSHLRLPMWLNEGLAMVTVDRYAGQPTVQIETLETLRRQSPQGPGRYRKVRADDPTTLVYHFVRGYWLTRYLMDTRPRLIPSVLSRRYRPRILEDRIAAAYDMGYNEFWRRIDGLLVAHFEQG